MYDYNVKFTVKCPYDANSQSWLLKRLVAAYKLILDLQSETDKIKL